MQVTIDQATRDKLERAQALLRHRVPSGDLAQVIDTALDALLARLVKRKFAATDRPRRPPDGERGVAAGAQDAERHVAARAEDPGPRDVEPGAEAGTRYVPAAVRRAVHERDGEQCTFVSADGVRCAERGFLERDHIEAFAAGGASTEGNIQMRCRWHNAYAAERHFGRAFMEARRRRGSTRAGRVAGRGGEATAEARGPSEPAPPPPPDLAAEVMLALRGLGVTPADARDAIARSAQVPATTLPERLRAALQALRITYASRSGEPMRPWGRGFDRGYQGVAPLAMGQRAVSWSMATYE